MIIKPKGKTVIKVWKTEESKFITGKLVILKIVLPWTKAFATIAGKKDVKIMDVFRYFKSAKAIEKAILENKIRWIKSKEYWKIL